MLSRNFTGYLAAGLGVFPIGYLTEIAGELGAGFKLQIFSKIKLLIGLKFYYYTGGDKRSVDELNLKDYPPTALTIGIEL